MTGIVANKLSCKGYTIINQNEDSGIELRTLTKPDLGLLHKWLNEPHLKPFYIDEPISLAEVSAKYAARIEGRDPCHCLISFENGEPFGFIQWYLNSNFPDYGIETIGKNRGVSFDYFIGCMGHLGRGLGSTMLKRTIALVSDQIAHPDQSFFIGHQVDNSKAVQCTTRAGFKFERNFVEDGKLSALYSRGS